MDPAGTITPESFSLIHMFLHADWVVKSVLIALALASLGSWMVIIDKFLRFSSFNREANRFEDQVGSGKPLEDVAAQAGDAQREVGLAGRRELLEPLRWRDRKGDGLGVGRDDLVERGGHEAPVDPDVGPGADLDVQVRAAVLHREAEEVA